MKQTIEARFPDGRVVRKQLPANASDNQIRAAFAKEYKAAGYDYRQAQIQSPQSNEDYWQERLSDQGELSAPEWSLTGAIESTLGDILGKALGEREGARIAGKATRFFNDATPVGDFTGMDEGGRQAYNGLTRGDLGQLAAGVGTFALSALPGALDKPVRAAGSGLNDMLGALMRDESGAIRAWHGSPHDFDKFSLDKIGTGEGAQAYGHGLYFAEEPEVARQYQRILGYKHTGGAPKTDWNDPASIAGYWANWHGGDTEKALKQLEGTLAANLRAQPKGNHDVTRAAVEYLRKGGAPAASPNPGRLYEVNIDANPEDFLDWDAPLSGQARAMAALNALDLDKTGAISKTRKMLEWARAGTEQPHNLATGRELLNAVSGYGDNRLGERPALMPFGLQGVQYLDQGSRPNLGQVQMFEQQLQTLKARGAGPQAIAHVERELDRARGGLSRNYVVFDDGLVEILNKY